MKNATIVPNTHENHSPETYADDSLSGLRGKGDLQDSDESNALVESPSHGAGKRGRPANNLRKDRPYDVSRKQGKRKVVKGRLTPSDKLGILHLYAVYRNKAEVSRQLGYGYKTIVDVIDQFNARDPVKTAEIIRRVDDELSLKLVDKTHKILDGITDEKIHKASLGQLAVGVGVLVDKRVNLQKQYVATDERSTGEFQHLSAQSVQDLLLTLKQRVSRAEFLRLDFGGSDSLRENGERLVKEVENVSHAVEATFTVIDMDGNETVSTK